MGRYEELVQAHVKLEEPTRDAIWTKPDASEVWLGR